MLNGQSDVRFDEYLRVVRSLGGNAVEPITGEVLRHEGTDSASAARAMFDKYDTNADGVLCPAEQLAPEKETLKSAFVDTADAWEQPRSTAEVAKALARSPAFMLRAVRALRLHAKQMERSHPPNALNGIPSGHTDL
jgi:hypothetical protein